MLAIEWLADQAEPADVPERQARTCCVTGRSTRRWVPRSEVFSPTFGNQAELAYPDGGCGDARVAQLLRNGNLRWRSWIVDRDGLRYVKRRAIRDLVLRGPGYPTPWGAYAAEDVRRHGGLLTRLNATWDAATVQLGPRPASAVDALHWYLRVEAMFDAGMRRKDLASLSPHPKAIEKVGWGEWMSYKEWARVRRGNPAYALCVWLLPTKEESDGGDA